MQPTSVILKPNQIGIFRDSGLEAQWVTSKEPNRAIIYLDSQDYVNEPIITSVNASTANNPGDFPSNLAFGTTRISVETAEVRYVTPNVNPINNVVQFFSSATGLTYSVTVPTGFYATSTALIAALVTALNTATGSSGLTFSSATITGFPDKYTLSSAGGNYYFLANSLAVLYGYPLWALPVDQVATASKVVGNMGLFYTTYIDFCSATLVKYVKLRTVATNLNSNIIFRLFLNSGGTSQTISLSTSNSPNVQYYFNPSEPITQIDIQLRDQFGNLLYVPQGADGKYQGFWWNISLSIET